jgi:hypothetical protein
MATYRTTDQRGTVVLALANTSGPSGVRILTLPITPEDIQITRPSRQAVTQTLTSAYQDHLGGGITTVGMRGHTGWRDLGAVDRNNLGAGTGYEVIRNLRDLLGDYDTRVARGDPSQIKFMLMLNLPNGWENFRVSKNSASFSRSRQQPLLYRYELQFTVLEDMNSATKQTDPSPNFVVTPQKALSVTLLPNVSTTNTTGGDVTGVSLGKDAATLIANIHSRRDLDRDDMLTYTGKGGSGNFDQYLAAVGNGDITLSAFAEAQYPSSVFGLGMWRYIVAANPDMFSRAGDDPTKVIVKAGHTYRVANINPKDVCIGNINDKLTVISILAGLPINAWGPRWTGGPGTFRTAVVPFSEKARLSQLLKTVIPSAGLPAQWTEY